MEGTKNGNETLRQRGVGVDAVKNGNGTKR